MVQTESRVWGSSGVEPTVGDEVIQGGEEYPADWMNWAMYAATKDIDTFADILNTLDVVDGVTEIHYDTLGNRSAASKAGRIFVATDTETIYYDDGSSWNDLAGKGTDADPIDGRSHFDEAEIHNAIEYEPSVIPRFETNAGAQIFIDMSVDDTPSAGTEQSVRGRIDGTQFLKLYAEADGAGGIQNQELRSFFDWDFNNQTLQNISDITGSTDVAGADEVNMGAGLEDDGADQVRTQGDAIADEYLSEGASPHQVAVNLGTGLEGDGADNIRPSGGDIAGNGLVEGANPYQVGIATDAIQTDELDLSITPTWTGTHFFEARIEVRDTYGIQHGSDSAIGLDFSTDAGSNAQILSSFGTGFLRFTKRSSSIGGDPPPASGNTAVLWGESGELLAQDQNGDIVVLTQGDWSRRGIDLQLQNGQAISDGNGNAHFQLVDTDRAIVAGSSTGFESRESFYNAVHSWGNTPAVIRDREASNNAIEHIPSASVPSTLKLTNALLDAPYGAQVDSKLMIPEYTDTASAPNDAGLYVATDENRLAYKDV